MNKSPPGPIKYYGTVDDEEYDPHFEFTQFLKEAKTHACHQKSLNASEKDQPNGTARPNKSWKSSIFPWLKKANKKSSHKKVIQGEPPPPSKSFPMNRVSAQLPKRPTSGPILSTLFKTRKEEFPMPYISLNNSRQVNPYGPVYMVT